MESQTGIVLIGMAGAGKSSIGRRLAKTLSRRFIDTDTLIEHAAGCSLQEIIAARGLGTFRALEEDILLRLDPGSSVVATGGSSVYSHKGMLHLRKKGFVIFLEVELSLLAKRIRNFDSRGLVKLPEQSFSDLYRERQPLYHRYADYIFSCNTLSEREICSRLVQLLHNKKL
ncbi:MAG: shikimate kinase [Desulfobulbaceae bacterium]|nr:shikimate kinase [Desulfobulbaceae bacterium]